MRPNTRNNNRNNLTDYLNAVLIKMISGLFYFMISFANNVTHYLSWSKKMTIGH